MNHGYIPSNWRTAEPAMFQPRHLCGYATVWHYDERAMGEHWCMVRDGFNASAGTLPVCVGHDVKRNIGVCTIEADSTGIFLEGKLYRGWGYEDVYAKVLHGDGYYGFSIACTGKAKWERAGELYRYVQSGMAIKEVSIGTNVVFRKTNALLCHPHEVPLVRSIQRLRLKHGLGHPPRSDWKNLGLLAAVTTQTVQRLRAQRKVDSLPEIDYVALRREHVAESKKKLRRMLRPVDITEPETVEMT